MILNYQKYLPDWKKAQIHRNASKIGFEQELSKNICECCHRKIDKQEISLCENTKSLQFLGFGFPLFYMFLRNCIILLTLLIISNNFISLYISISTGQSYCNGNQIQTTHPSHLQFRGINSHWAKAQSVEQSNLKVGSIQGQQNSGEQNSNLHLSCKCRNFMLLAARTDKVQLDYEFIFRISSFIIHVLGLLYIKDKIIKTWAYYDQMESDLSDYAVIVKNIPGNLKEIRGRLQYFIQTHMKNSDGNKYSIHQIILIPEGQKIHHLMEQQLEATELFLHAKQHQQQNLDHLFKQIEEIEQKKHILVRQTIKKINEDKINAKNAVIIFETEPEKEHFLETIKEYQEKGLLKRYFNKPQQDLIIAQAPQPKQIIYENLQHQDKKLKNLCIGYSLSLLFLVCITIIFYFVQLLKTNNLVTAIEEQEENPEDAKGNKLIATIIAWVTLFSIVFFNKFVMGTVLHYFTHLQKHDNKANQDFSFAFKYAVGMFFTTAMMTIAVQAMKFKNYYKHDFGVIQQETIMFFLCAFLVPFIWGINPLQLYHVYQRNKQFQKKTVTQHEANHLMADYHYDMGKRYAELIEMMWFTFFYADLIPLGAFLILVGFSLYYWIDKYNLLRRSSLQANISGDLAMKSLFLLDLTLFWRFLGQLIFDIQIREGVTRMNLIFLGLSVLYMLVPWQQFLELVNSQRFKLNNKLFSQQKARFEYDNYKIYHPIYSQLSVNQNVILGEQQFLINDIFLQTFLPQQENKQSQRNSQQQQKGNMIMSLFYKE